MGKQAVPPAPVSRLHAGASLSPLPEAIRRKVELEWGTEDDEYLQKVERNLEKALQEHRPDVVVYNAGTDILEGDRLGGLAISPQVRPWAGRGQALLWGLSSDGNVGGTGVPPEARGAGRQQQHGAGLDSQQDFHHPEGPSLPEPIFPVPRTHPGRCEAGRAGVPDSPWPPAAHPHGDLGRLPEAHGPHHRRLHP